MAVGADHATRVLPCCVEAPASYRPKAQYALHMLLLPLGIDPRWVGKAELPAHGLYYGTAPEQAPVRALRLGLKADTVAYFEGGSAYDRSRVCWRLWDGERWPVLFGEKDPAAVDLVASAFFWLSGWQEYTHPARDEHGRFPHAVSLQAAFDTTARPVVDAYREMLAGWLQQQGVSLQRRTWQGASWAFCPTHDIDYLRKWRGGMVYREVVPYFLRNKRRVSAAERLRRLGAFLRDVVQPGDPYRVAFERLHRETARRGGTATFFLKAGAHGPHDVFYDPADAFLRRRVAALEADGFEIGLHPSYFAHTHPEYLAEERARLDALVTTPLVSVRQHYLRYEWPATPRLHQAAGFRIDSSLGFSTHEGFRHATCLPFQLFDPHANAVMDVWEMPLAVMESALFNRRGLAAEEAGRVTTAILDACRRFGGVAVMLWHNVVWDELDHPGWGRHFIEALEAALERGACILALRDAFDAWLGGSAGVPTGASLE